MKIPGLRFGESSWRRCDMTEKKTILSMEDLPMVLKVEELMPILGIGRSNAYALVRSGRVRSIRIGHQFRIPREAVREFLDGTSV